MFDLEESTSFNQDYSSVIKGINRYIPFIIRLGFAFLNTKLIVLSILLDKIITINNQSWSKELIICLYQLLDKNLSYIKETFIQVNKKDSNNIVLKTEKLISMKFNTNNHKFQKNRIIGTIDFMSDLLMKDIIKKIISLFYLVIKAPTFSRFTNKIY